MTGHNFFRSVVALILLAAWDGGATRRTRADEPPKPAALEMKGYFVPTHQAAVGPVAGGRVAEVLVREGQKVKQGDVLARLDDIPARLDVQRAEARVQAAKARLDLLKAGAAKEEVAAARAEVDQAEENVRYRKLVFERFAEAAAKGGAQQSVVDEKASDLKAAKAQLEAVKQHLEKLSRGRRPEELAVAEAEVAEAVAVLKKAAYVLDTMTVRAPFDGTVLAVRVEAGTYVNPLAFSAPGHVCEIAKPGLEVEVDVGERDLVRVFAGQPCRIQSDANPKVVYQGKVVRLLPVANRAKGSVGVRVAVDIPGNDDSVRPEMAATVSFLKKE
jgi:multidrug resistance efflux pump